MHIMGEKNHIKIFCSERNWNNLWFSHFQNYVWHLHPPSKMADLTISRNSIKS